MGTPIQSGGLFLARGDDVRSTGGVVIRRNHTDLHKLRRHLDRFISMSKQNDTLLLVILSSEDEAVRTVISHGCHFDH